MEWIWVFIVAMIIWSLVMAGTSYQQGQKIAQLKRDNEELETFTKEFMHALGFEYKSKMQVDDNMKKSFTFFKKIGEKSDEEA